MLTLPYALAMLLAVGGSVEADQLNKQIVASYPLKTGDTEGRVLEILGEPKMRCPHGLALFTFGVGPPQWIYGTTIDIAGIIDPDSPFPNLLPLKFRIFSPHEGDLVIKWDDRGRVASIERPTPLQK
jgi:hypothetical protein